MPEANVNRTPWMVPSTAKPIVAPLMAAKKGKGAEIKTAETTAVKPICLSTPSLMRIQASKSQMIPLTFFKMAPKIVI